MWIYVHREFFTIFGQCINVLNYNTRWSCGAARSGRWKPKFVFENSPAILQRGPRRGLKAWLRDFFLLYAHEWPIEGSQSNTDFYFQRPLLVGSAELLVRAAERRCSSTVSVCGVQHLGLALHGFDELAVGAVAQEFEHFSEQRFVGFGVALPAFVGTLCTNQSKSFRGL